MGGSAADAAAAAALRLGLSGSGSRFGSKLAKAAAAPRAATGGGCALSSTGMAGPERCAYRAPSHADAVASGAPGRAEDALLRHVHRPLDSADLAAMGLPDGTNSSGRGRRASALPLAGFRAYLEGSALRGQRTVTAQPFGVARPVTATAAESTAPAAAGGNHSSSSSNNNNNNGNATAAAVAADAANAASSLAHVAPSTQAAGVILSPPPAPRHGRSGSGSTAGFAATTLPANPPAAPTSSSSSSSSAAAAPRLADTQPVTRPSAGTSSRPQAPSTSVPSAASSSSASSSPSPSLFSAPPAPLPGPDPLMALLDSPTEGGFGADVPVTPTGVPGASLTGMPLLCPFREDAAPGHSEAGSLGPGPAAAVSHLGSFDACLVRQMSGLSISDGGTPSVADSASATGTWNDLPVMTAGLAHGALADRKSVV